MAVERKNDAAAAATPMVKTVLFDFGGVLAEEGFRKGMDAIGQKFGVEGLFETADYLIYETGYVRGKASETDFWNALRARTGIMASDGELREEILSRFTLRDEMLRQVETLKALGVTVGILSDQTNWIYEVDAKIPFLNRFHYVFNSYKLGKGKRDRSLFSDVCALMGISPDEVLFVDDKLENARRAKDAGLKAICFKNIESFKEELKQYL